MEKAVTLILTNDENQVLGVSRKTDHNDFGLVGGRVEEYDFDLITAIERETKEETGLEIFNVSLIHAEEWGGYEQYTFVADYHGRIYTEEPHVVKWLDPSELLKGSFGEYNKKVFEKLNII